MKRLALIDNQDNPGEIMCGPELKDKSVKEKLLKLKQAINAVGNSFPLLTVELDFIEKMELEAEKQPVFREALKEIERLTRKGLRNIEDYNSIVEIKNTYSEAYIFTKLASLVAIEKVHERTDKTPDFKVRYQGSDLFVEVKSLNMLDGACKQRTIMQDALDSHCAVEDKIRKGARVATHVGAPIQPYYSPNKEYDPRSTRLVIESLIDKIDQNIKEEQFSFGDTVLLVDLSIQLPLISQAEHSIQERHYDVDSGSYTSGELWHVALGAIGTPISKPAEFEGADVMDGVLSKEGILRKYPFIKGLIFHVKDDFYSVGHIDVKNARVLAFLEYVSKHHTFAYDKLPRESRQSHV